MCRHLVNKFGALHLAKIYTCSSPNCTNEFLIDLCSARNCTYHWALRWSLMRGASRGRIVL